MGARGGNHLAENSKPPSQRGGGRGGGQGKGRGRGVGGTAGDRGGKSVTIFSI